jgi:hypothetical protein
MKGKVRRAFVAPAFLALSLTSACSMRVSGVVRDAATGGPIGGAVLTAHDGRNRISVSDPAGVYSVKTDTDTTQMTVSAPGYQAQTVTIPSTGDRYPVVFVTLQPNVAPPQRRTTTVPAPSPAPAHIHSDLPPPTEPVDAVPPVSPPH